MARMVRRVRVCGDPFVGDEVDARQLRAFVDACPQLGLEPTLCLANARGVVDEEGVVGQTEGRAETVPVPMHDGVRQFTLNSAVRGPELDRLAAAARRHAPRTAPVLVFPRLGKAESGDGLLEAALRFPEARAVLDASRGDVGAWAAGVHAIYDRAEADGSVEPGEIDDEAFRALGEIGPRPISAGKVPLAIAELLHVVDGASSGLDLLIDQLRSLSVETSRKDGGLQPLPFQLTVLGATPADRERHGGLPFEVEWDMTPAALVDWHPDRLRSVHAVVQPGTRSPLARTLAAVMASQRPLIVSSIAAQTIDLGSPNVVILIGGRAAGGVFAPDPRALRHGLLRVLDGAAGGDAKLTEAQSLAVQARRHTAETLVGPRLMGSASVGASRVVGASVTLPGQPQRPQIVLEAAIFDVPSSTAHLTIETARALVRRGNTDVWLLPVPGGGSNRETQQSAVQVLAERAPELVARLCRTPPAGVDLWLSSGWPPPRLARPDARCFAVRVDQEYGALPTELTPLVTDIADAVVVHSGVVRELVVAAGAAPNRVWTIPHGVDGEVFSPAASPDARVSNFKAGRKAVLFVGGLIWRKGFDVVVRTMIEQFRRDDPICLVVKPVGGGSSYFGFHLRELLEKLQRSERAVDVLVLDEARSDAEMAALYTACDVLLHPYRGEGFGLPVLEARACGLPVVVTDGGSTDDFCGRSQDSSGVLPVPSTPRSIDLAAPHSGREPSVLEPSAAAVARAVAEVLNSRTLRQEAAGGSQSIRDVYTWQAAASQIERLAGVPASESGPDLGQALQRVEPRSRAVRGTSALKAIADSIR